MGKSKVIHRLSILCVCVWQGESASLTPKVVQGSTVHEKIIAKYRKVYSSLTKKYEVKILMKALRLQAGGEAPGWGGFTEATYGWLILKERS